MSPQRLAVTTWVWSIICLLVLAAMPVFAGHGMILLGQLMFLGWSDWSAILLPIWAGVVLLVVVFPIAPAPARNWLALLGLGCIVTAMGLVVTWQGVAAFYPPFAYVLCGLAAIDVGLNVWAIAREQRVA